MLALTLALVAAGGLALLSVFKPRAEDARPPSGKPAEPRVAWRVQVSSRAAQPCSVADGWVVADGAGGLTKVSAEGRVLWRSAFSNESLVGVAAVLGGPVAVSSESGRVFGVDSGTGATLWISETGARFQHAPLAGMLGAESLLWLVSQEDGRLLCLRASDGKVLWTTEATNRCDGKPVRWADRIAYGNCDGAVYVFAAADGKPMGAISVGEDDQMAGGVLALASGLLATGTRQGNLAVINPDRGVCEAKVKVSESEAFITPAALSCGRMAMGADEGAVTLWRWDNHALVSAGRLETGAAIKSLLAFDGRFLALAGGVLWAIDSEGRSLWRLSLGDDSGQLAVNAEGDLVCLADGALVCVKGGGL